MPRFFLIVLMILLSGLGTQAAVDVKPVKIPILMYHHIRDTHPKDIPMLRNLSCPLETFQMHLQFLKERGYHTVTFREVKAYLEGEGKLPSKPVILTFDDGYDNNYWASLQLQDYGMRGVFYVVTRTLNTPGHLSHDQIKDMHNFGMEIGSHSIHHADLRYLLSWKVKREIEESKKILEKILEAPLVSFCYPSGAYNAQVLKIIKKSDYWFARTTEPGISWISGKHYELRTVRIYPTTTVDVLHNTFKKYFSNVR
jgi:peptidoglycan/xylan/chitin deacetylase (PgdA/CDA1 family)